VVGHGRIEDLGPRRDGRRWKEGKVLSISWAVVASGPAIKLGCICFFPFEKSILPESLCARVLRARYYPLGDLLNAELKNGNSFL
jgi:hypothetical protein